MEKTVKVTGRAKISVRPDTVRVRMTLWERKPEYENAMTAISEKTDSLKATLAEFGFRREDVRTLSFGIDRSEESYRDKNGNYKKRFKGYAATHVLKIEFPLDSVRLGKILSGLGRCAANPDVWLEYTVADPEPVRNALLAKAVTDSRTKAEVLTVSAGAGLGELISVDYSWREIEMVTFERECEIEMLGSMDNGPDIQPEDIDVTDTVTVIWSIR